MRRKQVVFAVVMAVCVAGCDSGSESGDSAGDGDGDGDGDLGPDAGGDLEGGALAGHVTRSAAPAAGGRGGLYIGVFTSDPVADAAAATSVGQQLIEDADMSADGAMISYRIDGIPPREEPYFVSAFLDDNNSVTDPNQAAPDRGDLVAIDGLASPQVVVSSETVVDMDIDLNFNLPF